MNKRVFLAGPVTGSGTYPDNLHLAISTAQVLYDKGFHPFVPHLYFLWEMQRGGTDQEQFVELCRAFLPTCGAVLRLPGESPGADAEMELAKSLGIPTFTDPNKLYQAFENGWISYRTGKVPRDFDELQDVVEQWLKKQPFYPQPSYQPLLGIGEEVGELMHAHLKCEQGIRGTTEEHLAAKKDAIGDIFIYIVGYALAEGLNIRECIIDALKVVQARDWNKRAGEPAPYSDMEKNG